VIANRLRPRALSWTIVRNTPRARTWPNLGLPPKLIGDKLSALSINTESNYCGRVLRKLLSPTSPPQQGAESRRGSKKKNLARRSAVAVSSLLVAVGTVAVTGSSPSGAQTGARAVKFDGVEILSGRQFNQTALNVLSSANQFQYVVINPAGGPEIVDGTAPSGTGYTPANPDVEDFALRAKRLSGGKVLGWMTPAIAPSRAVDYRDYYRTDGVMLGGYDCASAQSAAGQILSAWPGATVVIATAGCAAAGAQTIDPASQLVEGTSVSAGSLDPIAGYPVASATKLIVPAYFTNPDSWARVLSGIDDLGAVVVDVDSRDANRTYIQQLKARGVKVYAYIPTGYLTGNPGNFGLVSSRIAAVNNDADISGIFLDEVRSGCSAKAIADYGAMKTQAGAKELIYNPGQTAGSCFNNISNAQLNYEGTFEAFQKWPASEWGRTLPSNRIIHVVHTTGLGNIEAAVRLAKGRNAGLLWVSEGGTNSFQDFPSAAYFNAVRSALRSVTVTGETIAPGAAPAGPAAAAPASNSGGAFVVPSASSTVAPATTTTAPAATATTGVATTTRLATTTIAPTTTAPATTTSTPLPVATVTTVATTAASTLGSNVLPVAPPPAKAQTVSPDFTG
jgi:hypothetical protein